MASTDSSGGGGAGLAVQAKGLWYGSADPHGLGDVDTVPLPRRAPSAVLGARDGASVAELAVRAFPVANVAPITAPREPPAPRCAAVPPTVTCRSQVVPEGSMRLVRGWFRQLRRCLRAAERGDASLARRLRPDDLWLDHEHHSVPETAPWDWDLRPIARGEPATVMPVSGRGGVAPATSIALDEVQRCAAGFDDQAIVSEMLHGVSDDSLCRRGTLLCAPHAGALKQISIAVDKTAVSIERGWASGGHVELPCWPLRTCPFSLVDESARAGKPKFRLTTDLSWPHPGTMVVGGVEIDAVNSSMDRSGWPRNRMLRVRELCEAAAVLRGPRRAPRRVRLWSLDCEAFYRAVGRQRAELWRNGVCLPDGVQLDERCCFGDASAAAKCARISNFIVFQMRRALEAFDEAHPTRDPEWSAWLDERRRFAEARGADVGAYARLHWAGIFVDDAGAASADDLLFDIDGLPVVGADGEQRRRAGAHFEVARAVLEQLGWGSAAAKEVEPATWLVFLGVEIDLDGDRVRLSADKRTRYSAQAEQAAGRSACELAEYTQLLGRLQFAAQCYPLGRQMLHAAARVARAGFRLRGGRVRVTKAVRRDLLWWVAELRSAEHEGVPLAAADPIPPVGGGSAAIYADASGEQGYAAWAVADGELLYVHGMWSEAERTELIICEKELLASTIGLVALAPFLPPRIVSFSDNTVATAAMRRQTSRSLRMQQLVARRTLWLHAHDVVEAAERITTHANLWADLGSRLQVGEMVRQATTFGLRPREVEAPAAWRCTAALIALQGDVLEA